MNLFVRQAPARSRQLVVGFDLDMTLLDTRAGIAATFRQLTRLTGVHVDTDLVVSRLGPPLVTEMANWFPPSSVPAMVELYRSLYPDHAIAPTSSLPGAVEAVASVRAAGGSVIVVTSKLGRLASLHLAHAGISVDAVHGDVFAAGKAPALRAAGAAIYVGDHVADMEAGTSAGTYTVGVTSGPCSASALYEAGADVVLPSLAAFPELLARRLGGREVAEEDDAAGVE